MDKGEDGPRLVPGVGELRRIFLTGVGVVELLKSKGVVVICSVGLDGLDAELDIVKPAVVKFGEKLYFRFDELFVAEFILRLGFGEVLRGL